MPVYERESERLRALDAQVVGVSTDTRFANAAWAEQLGGITYPLLSDFYPHGAVAERYGVLMPVGMAERALILVDKDGIVRYIDVHETRDVPDPALIFAELEKLGS
jgi:alkyl hydroperoxide reductase subunit AhpC